MTTIPTPSTTSPSIISHPQFRSTVDRFRSTVRWTLIVVTGFNVLSAFAGGVGLLTPDSLYMPTSFLDGGPFSSFLVPGLLLLIVVGGTQAVALAAQLRRRLTYQLWSAIAGFGMVIWIVTEIGLINMFDWPQLTYLVTGLLQLMLVYALLGIVSWLPREQAPGTATDR